MVDMHSMSEIERIHNEFRWLAEHNKGRKHREGQYTMALCGGLWSDYGKQMLVHTGLGREQLWNNVGEAVRTVLNGPLLSKTMDFYPDLLLTDVSVESYPDKDFCGLDRFVGAVSITHVFEFKFLNAFTTLSRGKAREDTAKLYVLGEYLKNKNASGKQPHLEQVIFNFTAPGCRPKTNQQLRSWFTDGGFRGQFKDVAITIVSPEGAMETV